MSTTSYAKMKVDELKSICVLKGLKTDGLKKAELVKLLKQQDSDAKANDKSGQNDGSDEMSTSEGQDLSDDKGSEESEAEDGEEDPLDQDDESCEQMNELQLKIIRANSQQKLKNGVRIS